MQQFDYFADGGAAGTPSGQPASGAEMAAAHGPRAGGADDDGAAAAVGLGDRMAAFKQRRRAERRFVLVAAACLAAVTWFAWGYRDWAAYAFAFGAAREPIAVGSLVDVDPAAIPHNGYVSVSGITEHRGMQQKLVRGLGLSRDEFWYFRVLGSRGVFLEVPPDDSRFGPVTELHVSGRAIDPSRDQRYASLLAEYDRLFQPTHRSAMRIIQVDVRPGEGRGPFVVGGVLVAGLLAANVIALARLLRARASQRQRNSA